MLQPRPPNRLFYYLNLFAASLDFQFQIICKQSEPGESCCATIDFKVQFTPPIKDKIILSEKPKKVKRLGFLRVLSPHQIPFKPSYFIKFTKYMVQIFVYISRSRDCYYILNLLFGLLIIPALE